MKNEPSENPRPAWPRELFQSHRIAEGAPADEAEGILDAAAKLLAPNSRAAWTCLVLMQGVAVMAPVTWLLVVQGALSAMFPGFSMFLSILAVVIGCWWLRWRRLRDGWARARMAAEIARSRAAVDRLYPEATAVALRGVPELAEIARFLGPPAADPGGKNARDAYLSERILDQRNYYEKEFKKALARRRRLGKLVTLALDGGLFLAVGGVAIALSGKASMWLELSGLDVLLALLGCLLPLVAVLVQLYASYLELNRRTGSYAKQIWFLDDIASRFGRTDDVKSLREMVLDTEQTLLGEVVEWFFQAANQESFYRLRPSEEAGTLTRLSPPETVMGKILRWAGIGLGFTGRVIFGRILVAALAAVVATALIASNAPKHFTARSLLRPGDGRLLSSADADGWEPRRERSENGLIVIAHGLHDGAVLKRTRVDGRHWMDTMMKAIEERLGPSAPEICLVDWHRAAVPVQTTPALREVIEGELNRIESDATAESLPTDALGFLRDVAAIRAQAEEIGAMTGYKIAIAIRNGEIRRDRPIHLIGHSAGGFVVCRAARILVEIGVPAENLRVTLLDTPMPLADDIRFLCSGGAKIDYYKSSIYAQGIPSGINGFEAATLATPAELGVANAAHSYAFQWYEATIRDPGAKNGFAFSPFHR